MMDSRVHSHQTSVQVFPIFVALYVTGFLMEMVERWRFPDWTAIGVVLSILTIALAKHRIVFLAFLVLTTAFFLLLHFPEVANHINLLIFCNVLLIVGLSYSYLSPLGRRDFPAYFETLLSPVRLMLIVTYTVAGFHKFNYDFLNPEVSCIGGFLLRFWTTLKKPLFDEPLLSVMPVVLILFVIGVPAVLLPLRRRIYRLPWWVLLPCLVGILGVGALLTAWSYFASDLHTLIERQITVMVMGIAGLIVFWQMVEGPMLLVRRLQPIFLCFALLFHTYLGMIGFVDFQSLAMALLLAFVPSRPGGVGKGAAPSPWLALRRQGPCLCWVQRAGRRADRDARSCDAAVRAHELEGDAGPPVQWRRVYPDLADPGRIVPRTRVALAGRLGLLPSHTQVAFSFPGAALAFRNDFPFWSPHRREFFDVQQFAHRGRHFEPHPLGNEPFENLGLPGGYGARA
ncbi:MAG: YfhO family protein [Rhodospirillales bacterium]|nr:YfhO family protein [Rhodospirillales bacterium]